MLRGASSGVGAASAAAQHVDGCVCTRVSLCWRICEYSHGVVLLQYCTVNKFEIFLFITGINSIQRFNYITLSFEKILKIQRD